MRTLGGPAFTLMAVLLWSSAHAQNGDEAEAEPSSETAPAEDDSESAPASVAPAPPRAAEPTKPPAPAAAKTADQAPIRPASPPPAAAPAVLATPNPAAGPMIGPMPEPPKAEPPPVLKKEPSLEMYFEQWKSADAANKLDDADKARAALMQAVGDRITGELESYAVSFIRASQVHRRAGDMPRAVELAASAAALAPSLPEAHFVLASNLWASNPAKPVDAFRAFKNGTLQMWTEARHRRLALSEVGVAVVFALLGTALAISLIFFIRVSSFSWHELRHRLPRGTHPWAVGVVLGVLILLPLGFRLGLWSVLCMLFAVSTLYLSTRERWVMAAALAWLALIPLLGERFGRASTFAGTPAEDIFRLETSSPGMMIAAKRVETRWQSNKADALELAALGRYRLLQQDIPGAVKALEKAAELRNSDARVLVNLGNALLAQGNDEGALQMYRAATTVNSLMAEAFFNLGKLHKKRAASGAVNDKATDEAERGQVALETAVAIDQRLAVLKEVLPTPEAPLRGMASPPLSHAELSKLETSSERSEGIRRQLATLLFGSPDFGISIVAVLLTLGIALAGMLNSSPKVIRRCQRCAGAICRRCHPDLRPTSFECGVCSQLFAKKPEAPAALKIRKQIEIAKAQTRWQQLGFIAAVIVAGGGHLLGGAPVRGMLFALTASFLGASVFFHGLFRGPYGALPVIITVFPAAVLLLLVSLVSLRDLRRRQEAGTWR